MKLHPRRPLHYANIPASPATQHGAILIVCLALLVVLTLLGRSVMETSVLEEKMAVNMKDYMCAFESAEDALRAAEMTLEAKIERPEHDASASDGVYEPDTLASRWWDDSGTYNAAWWDANGVATDNDRDCTGHYILEYVDDRERNREVQKYEKSAKFFYHRITARGASVNGNSEVVLEATVGNLWDN